MTERPAPWEVVSPAFHGTPKPQASAADWVMAASTCLSSWACRSEEESGGGGIAGGGEGAVELVVGEAADVVEVEGVGGAGGVDELDVAVGEVGGLVEVGLRRAASGLLVAEYELGLRARASSVAPSSMSSSQTVSG